MTSINASIGRDHYRVNITARHHSFIADEGKEQEGSDLGPNPFELLAAALGACTCATVRMYADRKGIALDGMKVTVTLSRDEEKNTTAFKRDITLMGSLGGEDREKLLSIANRCPVHKILTNPISVETALVP